MINLDKTLEAIYALEPRPSDSDFTDIDETIEAFDPEISGAGIQKLINFLTFAIKELPQTRTSQKRMIGARLNLIGEILNKHIIADNSYASYKTKLRKVVRDHFLSDLAADKPEKVAEKIRMQKTREFLRSVGATKFDNRDRIVKRNVQQKKIRDERHKEQIDISQQFIQDLCDQMVSDIQTGMHKNAILLLMELCTGARFGECVIASKFVRASDTKNQRKQTVKSGLPAPKTVQNVKQTGLLKKVVNEKDLSNVTIVKPVLPYVDIDELLQMLNDWRASVGITDAIAGTYDQTVVNRYRASANKLTKEYLGFDASTHVFRGIYAVASFDLFRKPGISENDFIRNNLGHDALDISLSYNYINIIPNEE